MLLFILSDVFKFDPDFESNEEKYKTLKKGKINILANLPATSL